MLNNKKIISLVVIIICFILVGAFASYFFHASEFDEVDEDTTTETEVEQQEVETEAPAGQKDDNVFEEPPIEEVPEEDNN